jgi:dipeptidyl aminopeptidase/acylaminoacyl peptidase
VKALSLWPRGEEGSLAAGVNLGPYRILGLLGRGGMGDVYRAHDTRLARDVALKVLRPDDARDGGRLRRFEQESRAASALSHPAIAAVYDVGEARPSDAGEPLHYIAMELVMGRSLEARLQEGRLPLRAALDLAIPLAEGLARAHDAGIIHRDFKPSNVMLTPDGRPKILDFGLAKLVAEDGETRDNTLTSDGAVLGTVGYMSPEQARGETVTPAADQFAFGCVLYEMLAGRRAFDRPSRAETLSAILRDEPPPLQEASPEVPVPLRWIVERCLAKDPAARYASTLDLARGVQTVRDRFADLLVPVPRPVESSRRKIGRWAIPVILGGLVAAGWWLAARWAAAPAAAPAFQLLTFRSGFVSRALFVPNSNAILYTASWDGQPIKTYQTMPETVGFDRALDADVHLPLAYTPDGSQALVLLGVHRATVNPRGTLAWWPALGGRPRPIVEQAGWADWAARGKLLAVVRDGGEERVLELRDDAGQVIRTLHRSSGAIAWVAFSPDEQQVAFIRYPSLNLATGEIWIVATDGSGGKAVSPLFNQCVGLDWNDATGEVWFTGTPAGSNSFSSGIWVIGRGEARPVLPLPGVHRLHALSSDGHQALLVRESGAAHVAVRHAGQAPRLLPWFGWSVVSDLSADARWLLFYDVGATEATWGTWMRPVEGGEAVRLSDGVMSRFSPDGRSIVTIVADGGGPGQVALVPVGAGERKRLTSPPSSHEWPSFLGPTALLYLRREAARREVWRMNTDGSDARSLGVSDCDLPAASPAGDSFVCVAGTDRNRLALHEMAGGSARPLLERPRGSFQFVRWNSRGDKILAVTTQRELLVVSPSTGRLDREEILPYPGASPYDRLIGAALDEDGRLQTYSMSLHSASLYRVTGLRSQQ